MRRVVRRSFLPALAASLPALTASLPALAASLLMACGSNAPELPPGLEAALNGAAEGDRVYPVGPYGTETGFIAHNRCFSRVWLDPVLAKFDPRELREVCFSDFYDPSGAKGVRLLLVSTAAAWCTGCRLEWGGGGSHQSLSLEQAARKAAGFEVFGLMFEDEEGNPATLADLEAWTEAYDVTVPFGLDPDFLMGAFASQNLQPFNMLLDTRTMRIVLAVTGEATDVILERADRELGKR